jgi:hypothetical protein
MNSTIAEILTEGANQTRGPLRDYSVSGGASYTLAVPANPNRKFLVIQPSAAGSFIHFLRPGRDPAEIADSNSLRPPYGSQPLIFDRFVPTSAVYIKGGSATAIYEG